MLFLWQTAAFHERQAAVRARQAVTQTQRLRSAVDELLVAIAEEPSIRSQAMEPFRKKLLNSAGHIYRDLVSEIPDDAQLLHELGETMSALASIHGKLGEPQQAIELVDDVQVIFENANRPVTPSLQTKLLQSKATSLRSLGRYREAEACQTKVIQIARTIAEAHPDSNAHFLAWIEQLNQAAAGRLEKKDFAGATPLIDQAYEALVSAYDRPDRWPLELECYLTLKHRASLFSQTQRESESKDFGLQALKRLNQLQQSGAIRDPEATEHLVTVHQTIGLAGSHSGDFSLAEEHYDQAIDANQRLINQHPQVAKYPQNRLGLLYSRALIHFFQQEYDSAAAMLETSINRGAILQDQFPEMATGFRRHEANSLNLLYGIHRRRGDDSQAKDCLNQAIETCDRLLRADERDFQALTMKGNFLGNLGFLNSTQGNRSESLQLYLNSIAVLEPVVERQSQGESVTFLLSSYLGAATQADKLQQYDVSLDYGNRFLELAEASDARRPIVLQERAKWRACLEDDKQAEAPVP